MFESSKVSLSSVIKYGIIVAVMIVAIVLSRSAQNRKGEVPFPDERSSAPPSYVTTVASEDAGKHDSRRIVLTDDEPESRDHDKVAHVEPREVLTNKIDLNLSYEQAEEHHREQMDLLEKQFDDNRSSGSKLTPSRKEIKAMEDRDVTIF